MAFRFEGARTVLTGASSGIGLALAKRLCAARADLLTFGRREAAELPPDFPDAAYHSVEFASADAARLVARAVAARGWNGLDLLILNAGTGRHLAVEEEGADSIAETVAVNLMTPIATTRALAALLSEAGGRVVLIGSAAHRGASGFPVYAATKGALAGFARALRAEWQGRVGVQIVHPGPTATGMHARAGHDPGRLGRYYLPADEVAGAIVAAIGTGRSPVSAGHLARFFRRGA